MTYFFKHHTFIQKTSHDTEMVYGYIGPGLCLNQTSGLLIKAS